MPQVALAECAAASGSPQLSSILQPSSAVPLDGLGSAEERCPREDVFVQGLRDRGFSESQSVSNISPLRHRALPSEPRPRDIISGTRTATAPGAAATAHICGLLAGRASPPA